MRYSYGVLWVGVFRLAVLIFMLSCWVEAASPEQTLAAMDACRDRVINGLSLGDKMALRAAMDAIQGNPELVAANRAVANAPSAEARVVARNRVASLKLDLLGRQNPSLKPILDKIRTAQALIPQ
jgi:hypothetical protein